MRRLCLVFVVLISQLLPGLTVGLARAATEHLVISEVQTASKANASSEFVELYNPTDQTVDLTSWVIQYQAATTTSTPTVRAHLNGSLPAHRFYLIATKDISPRDTDLSEGLSGTAGSIILVKSTTEIDRVGWGTGSHAEKTKITAAVAGGSIERLPGAANATSGNAIDTDDNSVDFASRATAEPQSLASVAEVPDYTIPVAPVSVTPTETEATSTTPGVGSVGSSTANGGSSAETVEITELFIDPASPQLDSKDEFVELHNYGATSVNLGGFQLQCGSNYRDHYTLPSVTINPGQYLVVYASESKLSLTNTGGGARLLSPSGATIDEAALYEAAKAGNSWAAFDDGWAWTTTITPAAANVFTAPAEKTSAAKTTSSTAAKSTTAKASASKTTAAAKKSTTNAAAGTSTDSDQASGDAKQSVPVSGWLLAGLGIITIGYAIYECRHYIHNFYELARRKLSARKTNRQST